MSRGAGCGEYVIDKGESSVESWLILTYSRLRELGRLAQKWALESGLRWEVDRMVNREVGWEVD